MKLLFINHIQNARQSLSANRTRSFLTMLGVTIGVASITIILSLSAGASRVVGNQVNALGGNIAVIRPGTPKSNVLNQLTQLKAQRDFSVSTITKLDLQTVMALQHVDKVAPIIILSGTIKADSVAPADSPVLATTSALADISNLDLRTGQFISDEANSKTATIGAQLSINLFGTEDSIGRLFKIRDQSFSVSGILKRKNTPINYNLVDFDNTAIINMTNGDKLGQDAAQIQQIDVKSDSIANLQQMIININKSLAVNHKGENDFDVLTGEQIAQPTSQLFFAIAGATTAVAGISLLVGGIGIMNIMLVNVAERTREIGIRKALGANNADITAQFMIESIAIGLGGGLGGYVLGYAIAFSISTFLTFNPVINWQIAATAAFISLVMGTVFGIYPALRAARKDPIDSLREYN
jgi:ABC-type antimicrobial peptide transport system permease subunit